MELDEQSYQSFIAERREQILERVSAACARAGRDASEVELLAVSKTVGTDELLAAWRAGWHGFAENRPQELGRKLAFVEGSPEMAGASFDMISNLQKNKINQVIGRVRLIHSVSSAELAEQISARCEREGIVADVLLETNVSGERSKSGFSPDELRAAAEGVCNLAGIRVRGLMTMAPKGEPDVARRTFSGLRELEDELSCRLGTQLDVLSCGMSDDYQIAIEEGATVVRLGRTVFDPNYQMGAE